MDIDTVLSDVRAIIGDQRALLYEKELATLPTHREVLHAAIARLPKEHTILFVDNSIPLTDAEQAARSVVSKAQHAAHAISECTTPGNTNTAQRLKSMFGYEDESDPRAVVWHAPFETPVISLDNVDAIILSGSGAMVTSWESTDWMQREMAVIREAVERKIPILGICFGHQIMAQALGGRVDWLTDVTGQRFMEIGPTTAQLTEAGMSDPLFAGFDASFTVQATHSQEVVEIAPEAILLATNEASPMQALRYGTNPAWSLQNHPENSQILMDIRIHEMEQLLTERFEKLPKETAALLGYGSFSELVRRLEEMDTTAAKTQIFANFINFVADYR